MATYKVPQDVEADDKLIGPFSFRQFIYLMIVAAMIALAWVLSRIFIGLAIIPVPIMLLFGALALPLRKDQPMEIYLAAMVSFYLKPRVRKWDADGIDTIIEITAPHVVEVERTKGISQEDAQQRLGYLATLVDTGGWSVRGQTGMPVNTSLTADSYAAAQNAEDVLDETNSVSRSFDYMLSQSDAKHHQQLLSQMRQPTPTVTPAPQAPVSPYPTPQVQPIAPAYQPVPQVVPPTPDPSVSFNPYPTFHQTVIQPPADDTAHHLSVEEALETAKAAAEPSKRTIPSEAASSSLTTPQPVGDSSASSSTSEKEVSADIINLASNTDLSIETIAREANRIKEKEAEEHDDEFVISFR